MDAPFFQIKSRHRLVLECTLYEEDLQTLMLVLQVKRYLVAVVENL